MPRKIKPHVNSYCTFCEAEGIEKVRAVWRSVGGLAVQQRACDAHKDRIVDPRDDGHRSEADYQTWMRL